MVQVTMRIIGVQDFPMAAPAWLDDTTSVSWLRAFEQLAEAGHEVFAILREHNYDYKMARPIRGVRYIFTKTHEKFAQLIKELEPDRIMYNCCYYWRLPTLMQTVKALCPTAHHIIRTHHEVKRVLPKPLLAQVLEHADHMILSTHADWEAVAAIEPVQQHTIIPFGVDLNYYGCCASQCSKTLDFIASCSGNPVKNLPLLKSVFEELAARGYTTQNVVGMPKQQYAQRLQSARVYFSPTTSEASGSRSLLEAYASGAYPVVSAQCVSTCELVALFGGSVTDTESGNVKSIADHLERVLHSLPDALSGIKLTKLSSYSEDQEVSDLVLAMQLS